MGIPTAYGVTAQEHQSRRSWGHVVKRPPVVVMRKVVHPMKMGQFQHHGVQTRASTHNTRPCPSWLKPTTWTRLVSRLLDQIRPHEATFYMPYLYDYWWKRSSGRYVGWWAQQIHSVRHGREEEERIVQQKVNHPVPQSVEENINVITVVIPRLVRRKTWILFKHERADGGWTCDDEV